MDNIISNVPFIFRWPKENPELYSIVAMDVLKINSWISAAKRNKKSSKNFKQNGNILRRWYLDQVSLENHLTKDHLKLCQKSLKCYFNLHYKYICYDIDTSQFKCVHHVYVTTIQNFKSFLILVYNTVRFMV